MKLTRQDRQVINNFAKLNKNLEFKKDLKQQSGGRNLLAEYTLQSDEFKSFLIYDTKEFLKVINCFNNPKVIINDDLITLQEFNNEFRYHTAEKSMMVLPEKLLMKRFLIKHQKHNLNYLLTILKNYKELMIY